MTVLTPSQPDYANLRHEKRFSWFVGASPSALLALTGHQIGRTYNLNVDVTIDVHRRGRPLFRQLWPNADDVPMPALSTPAISYGHPNCLGSELLFPEIGEVAHTHPYGSLEEGIKRLQQPVDFATAGMTPYYLEFRRCLQKAFSGESVGFSFGCEGPLTTAYSLRGEDFFYDLMDQPDQTKDFLRLTTSSITDYRVFLGQVTGGPHPNPKGTGMCDDIASMVPAHMFAKFVVPFWEQYYQSNTTGRRTAHIEDLRTEQLSYLEQVGLVDFDPSISPKLNPKIIRDHCRVPFKWRLGSFHYREMDCAAVQDWVFQAAADGTSSVITYIEATLCQPENVPKVNTFIDTAKVVERMLREGATRADLATNVSDVGKKRFWNHWPE